MLCRKVALASLLQDERMKKAVGVVADNFNTMRTGRANPAILDRIQVSTWCCSSIRLG